MAEVVLGVAGGIAAYKACGLVRPLREAGHGVTVVPTANSLRFVGLDTWRALSGRPVTAEVWSEGDDVPHVRIGRAADLVLVAPATADLLARTAAGRADDLLTNVLLTATCPVLLAPAMHTEMWTHPATRDNVARLRRRGTVVVEPDEGRLTGADSGPGRLPEPAELLRHAELLLDRPDLAAVLARRDLAGRRLLITAGGTREALDPVRFLGNASSGRMGVALARAALLRGAAVDLVAASLQVEPPAGARVHPVVSTAELDTQVTELAPAADAVVMAAAVADWTPAETAGEKQKKEPDQQRRSVELVQTPDVLAGLARTRSPGQVLVGFAAETVPDAEQRLEAGRAKLARKGCDLLVLNDVSGGRVFGAEDTAVEILHADGSHRVHQGSKTVVAHHILDALGRRWARA